LAEPPTARHDSAFFGSGLLPAWCHVRLVTVAKCRSAILIRRIRGKVVPGALVG
jgi:hypothetical protein